MVFNYLFLCGGARNQWVTWPKIFSVVVLTVNT
jgi:hypothetical protein